MMKSLLVVLVSLCVCHAEPQDLSGKVFTFPVSSSTSYVTAISRIGEGPYPALTMCLRFFSSATRAQALFSLATPNNFNGFLLFKPSPGVYRLHIHGSALEITGLPDELNAWNSLCWTWDSFSGLTALWVNGRRSTKSILGENAPMKGIPSIILAQDQDTYGGGFDQAQSFVGDLTDVHLWDSVLSPCEIRFFMDSSFFTPGNLLSWKDLQYTGKGQVFVEKSDFDKLCV